MASILWCRVHSLCRTSAVFQQGQLVPIWGWASPGASIEISFAGQIHKTQAQADSSWEVCLDPLHPNLRGQSMQGQGTERQGTLGQSLVLTCSLGGTQTTLTYDDILVGDVWYCAGQSNMEFGMGTISNSQQELCDADYPAIRLYLVSKRSDGLVHTDEECAWFAANKESLVRDGWGGFSALAFLMARRRYKETGVPQACIQAAYGGCPILSFIAPPELAGSAELASSYQEYCKTEEYWKQALRLGVDVRHPWAGISDCADLKPGTVYNAMTAPVAPYAIRGVLWYQGETDVPDGILYLPKLQALFAGFRRLFRKADLPIFLIQLPPWRYSGDGLQLTRLWQAQMKAAEDPGIYLVGSLDCGDLDDIHPAEKSRLAKRLADLSLYHLDGRTDLAALTPKLVSTTIQDKSLQLCFENVTGPLQVLGGGEGQFRAVFGDGTCLELNARTWVFENRHGLEVLVSGEKQTQDIRSLRYAWSDTAHAAVFTETGLALSPFEFELGSKN